MYKRLLLAALGVAACAAAVAPACFAQSAMLTLPRDSQRARVSQRIGITDISILYHRPLVKGRKIREVMAADGKIWRAGANENTVFEVSDPVTIEGQPLPKGAYGLHMIPGDSEWTVIFSKNSSSWGSFSYNEAEDALRVAVKAHPDEKHEALTYDFDDPTPTVVTVVLRWDTIAVPFKVGVDTPQIVEQSLKNQLRGRVQYEWQPWDEAANYLTDHKLDPQQALKDADQSIRVEERFENLMTKARVLDTLDRQSEGQAVRAKALATGSALQVHVYGRQLQRQGKQEEAFTVFRGNIQKYPENWLVHSEIARIACAKGDWDTAVKEMKMAVQGADDQNKPAFEALVKRLEARQDINN
jgi:tetratricopeptide (TPR) repeat protein